MAAASSAVALRTDRSAWVAGRRDLLLPERPEQDVRERPVHRLRHVHREDEPRGAVERPGDDQELVLQREPHRRGREPGVGIQQGDHRRHVGAANGDDHHHAEEERDRHDQREEQGLRRVVDHVGPGGDGHGEEGEIDEVLVLENDRPLRQDLLELPGGHQAARERERTEDDFNREHRHHERRTSGTIAGGTPQCRPA